jgi:hypothetical protein
VATDGVVHADKALDVAEVMNAQDLVPSVVGEQRVYMIAMQKLGTASMKTDLQNVDHRIAARLQVRLQLLTL